MRHSYQITVAERRADPAAATATAAAALSFDFENHDDLFEIVDRVRARALFDTDAEAKSFGVGLKLLGQVLIAHRDDELFKEFAASFGRFMKTLKSR